ncbi:molybdenum cofactor synthesis domain-containing protein/competence/damage-inducible protein CinA N-terminal domain-containing protein [Rosenbergiella nectarea]|uniref:Molybdenum cofactor synthesis domain-containing protein/competence/damage-inducible protein CinA N-terminal domain-containing protein n=1 Tax=Rosenbergiella nectarea TaxID=988801 RepID=A0A1H9LB17_9GAMM|nr:CinA family nicotinamide mononucleotide deamidase-related protein [Rosenbergiella nectarea]SER08387.1 molybdenum cofactor synthesis domain-containing protein/competence/damage-inducible protein CinA N-terminal domain-containing protein [Rosenbergiella nectarea]
MLSTGDEVLHGEIVDTNAVWLANTFYEAGYAMTFRTTSGDCLLTLVQTLQQRSRVADVLIVNGGLGPTSDDFTAQAAAQAAGVGLVRNAEWLRELKAFFERRGREMAAINLKQADNPDTAEMLPNGNGTACGFRLELNDCQIFFTPGPPAEFKLMITEQVLPRLAQYFPLPEKLSCLRLTTFGRGESFIAALLADISLPAEATLGYRAAAPIVEIKLSGYQTQLADMEACWQVIKARVSDFTLFEGKGSFAAEIATWLSEHHYRLQLNEGFSAGLLNWTLANGGVALGGTQITGTEEIIDLETWAAPLSEKPAAQTLFLAISPLANRREIGFILATPQQTYTLQAVISDALLAAPHRLQEVVVLQAMYLVHRWLSGQPVTLIYQGLELIAD